MSTRTESALKAPKPRLLLPEHAYDYEYWARRLVHLELLRDAVALALFRAPLLAVPTGATRRGGQLHMGEGSFAHQAVLALEGLPGFAQLSHSGPIVEWGDKPPALCRPKERLQFYGLRVLAEELADHAWPPADRGHGTETGRWPPASEQPPGRNSHPRETGSTVAALALP
ncbi:DUF6302 family protein [Streptomyces sp. A5-4]|uniref:DUF6302 family protein n=1 Tax=Streptomyces sp. A5-4 TaxID=3384771 RepID=UPI003DA959FD